jgi:hypothetical protein
VYAKLKGCCARIALILALCTDPDSNEVGTQSIGAACDIIDYFKAHADQILPLSVKGKRTPEKQCEDKILRRYEGGEVLTKREVQRSFTCDVVVFNKTHAALVELGRIRKTRKEGKDGRQLEAYRLADEE